MYAPIIYETIETNGTKLAKVIIRQRDFDAIKTESMQTEIWTGKLDGFHAMQNMFYGIRTSFGNLCRSIGGFIENQFLEQLDDNRLMNFLKKEKFDIGLGEPFDLCYYGVLHKIGLKNYITATIGGVFDHRVSPMGVPPAPSFVPSMKIYDTQIS